MVPNAIAWRCVGNSGFRGVGECAHAKTLLVVIAQVRFGGQNRCSGLLGQLVGKPFWVSVGASAGQSLRFVATLPVQAEIFCDCVSCSFPFRCFSVVYSRCTFFEPMGLDWV